MKVLELFSGTGSFSNVAKEHGHEVFRVDNCADGNFDVDLKIDIMDLTPQMIIEKFGQPDVIWASPPCTKFSILQVRNNWRKEGDKYFTKNKQTDEAIELVKHTLKLILDLKPKYYFIENPRAMLRKQEFIPNDKRKTVTYCKYGMPYQKATDIWTNCDDWKPREICKANSPCHVRSPRGSRTGIQGSVGFRANRQQKHPIDISMMNGKPITPLGHLDFSRLPNWDGSQRVLRGIVPRELCEEIIKCCEVENGVL